MSAFTHCLVGARFDAFRSRRRPWSIFLLVYICATVLRRFFSNCPIFLFIPKPDQFFYTYIYEVLSTPCYCC